MDLPADVTSVLTQLFAEAQRALADGDRETARSAVASAATVTEHKVPAGALADRLQHGCERVQSLLDGGQPCAATEYLAAMERRVAASGEDGGAGPDDRH